MNFLSIEFAFFLGGLLFILFLMKNPTARKYILLLASCIFYAWWDWRLFVVMAVITILNYYLGLAISGQQIRSQRLAVLWMGIGLNVLALGYFKYANFFLDSLETITGASGSQFETLNIIAPLGISFITFEAVSYLVDIYCRASSPAASLLDYGIFISFFPRVASGPIIRARNFLPQLKNGITILPENVFVGLQTFLQGLIKKLVIADNVAVIVDHIYASPSLFSPGTVWLGVLAYSIQILCDFSGYTDMAVGVGRMLGFHLPVNFNLPYTSQSVTEFWQRWHISLSTWFRDYLFYPLQRARKKRIIALSLLNLLLTMLVCGLWHGASWNFIVWGGLLGLYMVIERLFFKDQLCPREWASPAAWLRAGVIFILISLTWIPFRSPDWGTTLIIFKKLFLFSFPHAFAWYYTSAVIFVPLIFFGGIIANRYKLEWPHLSARRPAALALIFLEILIVFFFSRLDISPFIYSQF